MGGSLQRVAPISETPRVGVGGGSGFGCSLPPPPPPPATRSCTPAPGPLRPQGVLAAALDALRRPGSAPRLPARSGSLPLLPQSAGQCRTLLFQVRSPPPEMPERSDPETPRFGPGDQEPRPPPRTGARRREGEGSPRGRVAAARRSQPLSCVRACRVGGSRRFRGNVPILQTRTLRSSGGAGI